MKKFYVFLILLCSLLPLSTRAQESSVGVVISEINWAGSSASNADEWIELTNRTGETVDIGGWILTGSATNGDSITLAEGSVIGPSGTFVLANYDLGSDKTTLEHQPDLVTTSLSLSNSVTEITLTKPDGALVDFANETLGSSNPYVSMERDLATLEWKEATTSVNLLDPDQLGTPGVAIGDPIEATTEIEEVETNTCVHDVTALQAEIENLEAMLALYAEPMSIDPIHTEEVEETPVTTEDFEASVFEEEEEEEEEEVAPEPVTYAPEDALINEFVSDPETGEEWVELLAMTDVDLTGWQLQDATGKATLLEGELVTGDFIVINAPKGQLNNGGDDIVLLDGTDGIIDSITYGDEYTAPAKGEALARTLDSDWALTTELTPGERNTFPITYEETNETSSEEPENQPDADPENEAAPKEITVEDAVTASSLENAEDDVEEEAADTEIHVSGIMTALPGTFGKQVAYIDGQQLYFYHADWPALALGDRVTVAGEYSTARGESRLKISDQADIVVTGSGSVDVKNVTIAELADLNEGTLVQLHGDYITREGSKLTLEDETGSVTVFAHDNTGISWTDHQSAQLEITGVLRFVDGETRIYPRSDEDVSEYVAVSEETLKEESETMSTAAEDFDSVIGATVGDVTSWGPWIGGTLVTATGAILAYWFVKYRLDLNSSPVQL
jgi:hypothetical protein